MRVLACALVLGALTACSTTASPDAGTAVPLASATATEITVEPTPAPTSSTTTAPVATLPVTTPPTVPDTTVATAPVTPEGFEQVSATAVTADGTVCELCLWLAETGEQRELGLMHVTDLGGADGMVFRYSNPATGAFWMKNTVMPLSIAFYDAGGAFLGAFDMAPCTADPCPTYQTPNDFVLAVETTQGGLDQLGLTPGSTLTIHDLPCDPG